MSRLGSLAAGLAGVYETIATGARAARRRVEAVADGSNGRTPPTTDPAGAAADGGDPPVRDGADQRLSHDRGDCRNCGASESVRGARIATVPDRETERIPLCDDCRIAAAARDDDPGDCAEIGRRVADVGGADGRCDNCGYIGRLHPHAVVPLSDVGRAHHANGVALCETCHDAAHGHRRDDPTT